MYALQEPLSSEYILHKFSQEQLMEYYLGIPLVFNKPIHSPLRKDKNPSCSLFYTQQGDLFFKDFSGHFTGNVFHLVKYLYNCNYHEALNIIADDFKLRHSFVNKEKQEIIERKIYEVPPKTRSDIKIKARNYNTADKNYWVPYGITRELLSKFDISALSHLWVNSKLIYTYSKNDPAYAYRFGKGHFKIYFPRRKERRFLSNTDRLQGLNYLPETSNVLVITKSYKDVILLSSYGIPAIAPQSESTYPNQKMVEELRKRFYKIFTLYDFDYAGVKTAAKARRLYNITPVFITNGRLGTWDRGAKDITDYYKLKGRENTRLLIEMAKSRYLR